MKIFILAVLLVTSAFAQDKKEEKIEEVKQQILSRIDKRISAIQEHKSCIQGASSREQIKSCRDSHKESMKKLKADSLAERKNRKK